MEKMRLITPALAKPSGETELRTLPLGRFAYERATAKLDDVRNEFETWRDVALSTDFEQ